MNRDVTTRYGHLRLAPLLLLALLLQACAGGKPPLPRQIADQRIDELHRAIQSLGAEIQAHEASRAARAALGYSLELARKYEVTDSALVHNIKVNLGLRERGLCVDWTRDLMTRLEREKFASLDLHWAIANYESTFRLEHSTVVISARGDGIEQGLVLDPWRYSGNLYWARTTQDTGYQWKPQAEVHALKREREQRAGKRNLDR